VRGVVGGVQVHEKAPGSRLQASGFGSVLKLAIVSKSARLYLAPIGSGPEA